MYYIKIACAQRPPPVDARIYIMCTYLSIRHSDNQTYYLLTPYPTDNNMYVKIIRQAHQSCQQDSQ